MECGVKVKSVECKMKSVNVEVGVWCVKCRVER